MAKAQKTAAQRRQEANKIHEGSTFRMMGPSLVAEVKGAEFLGDRMKAQRVANKFKGKGWTAMVTSKNDVIATVTVPR